MNSINVNLSLCGSAPYRLQIRSLRSSSQQLLSVPTSHKKKLKACRLSVIAKASGIVCNYTKSTKTHLLLFTSSQVWGVSSFFSSWVLFLQTFYSLFFFKINIILTLPAISAKIFFNLYVFICTIERSLSAVCLFSIWDSNLLNTGFNKGCS